VHQPDDLVEAVDHRGAGIAGSEHDVLALAGVDPDFDLIRLHRRAGPGGGRRDDALDGPRDEALE